VRRNLQILESHPFAPKFYQLLNKWRLIFCEKQVPKGFEKYFPANKKQPKKSSNGNEKPKQSSEKQSSNESQTQKQSKTPQTGSSKQNPWRFEYKINFGPGSGGKGEEPNKWATIALVTTLGVLGLLAYNEMRYKEITWKEFITNYLSRGIVDKLEVVNKKWVRVRFLPGNAIEGGNVLWFNIGSVDTFERNLENIQLEMNIEPPNFVPVVYKTEMDG
jgi:AFG3 family protein